MAKSFCNGCKHWEWAPPTYPGDSGFHYCDFFQTDSLLERKSRCNGKYKENKV